MFAEKRAKRDRAIILFSAGVAACWLPLGLLALLRWVPVMSTEMLVGVWLAYVAGVVVLLVGTCCGWREGAAASVIVFFLAFGLVHLLGRDDAAVQFLRSEGEKTSAVVTSVQRVEPSSNRNLPTWYYTLEDRWTHARVPGPRLSLRTDHSPLKVGDPYTVVADPHGRVAPMFPRNLEEDGNRQLM